MLWYTQGRVSDEQAAQYAGLSRISFIDAFAAARLPAFRFGTDELWEEVYPAAQAAGGRGRMAGVEPGGLLTASQESGVDVSFAPEAAEEALSAARSPKGGFGRARRPARCGPSGSRPAMVSHWLARRLRWEVQVETLHAAAARLADLGGAAVTPITRELGNYPTPDQACPRSQALRWIADDPSAPTIEETSVELLLAKFLQHRTRMSARPPFIPCGCCRTSGPPTGFAGRHARRRIQKLSRRSWRS